MKIWKYVLLLALLAGILVFPLLTDDQGLQSIGVFTLLYASAVIGWNILSGYSGYISLGYASFTGLGGYTIAIICDHWQIPGDYLTFLLVPVAGLATSLFAIPMGLIALRTRRVTFIVITIAMMFVWQALAFNLTGLTDGSSGIIFPLTTFDGYFFNTPFYYVSLVLLLFSLGISWWIRHSKFGLGLLAIRDDEDHALGLGVRTWAFKISAYMIAAFIGGMVGAMFAYYQSNIFPQGGFDPVVNLRIALMGFLGGTGTLAGPVIGAFLLEPLQQYLTLQFGSDDLNLIILGALLLLIILVLPEGIYPALRRIWFKWVLKRDASPAILAQDMEPEKAVLLKSGTGERG